MEVRGIRTKASPTVAAPERSMSWRVNLYTGDGPSNSTRDRRLPVTSTFSPLYEDALVVSSFASWALALWSCPCARYVGLIDSNLDLGLDELDDFDSAVERTETTPFDTYSALSPVPSRSFESASPRVKSPLSSGVWTDTT